MIEAVGLSKRYGDHVAVDGVDLDGRRRPHPRRARAQRRRQVHDRAHAHHHDPARRRHRPGRRPRRRARRRRRCAASSASPARTPRSTSCSPAPRTWCWWASSPSCPAAGAKAPGRRAARALRARPTPPAAWSRPTPAACAAASTSPPAWSTRPPVLFLDEPTTGLDPTSRLRMWDVIRELVADGTTVLLTTQYLDEADALADRISVIDHGTVIADGTARELKARIGGEQLEVTLADAAPRRGRARSAPLVAGPGAGRRRTAGASRRRSHRATASPPRSSARSTTPASPSTTSRSTARRSTTCSSPSPAAPPTPTDPTPSSRRSPMSTTVTATRPCRRTAASVVTASAATGGRNVAVLTRRNLIHVRREPAQLSDATVQPVLFTVLFVYIFGAAMVHPRRRQLQGLRHRRPGHDEPHHRRHGHRRRAQQRPVHGRHRTGSGRCRWPAAPSSPGARCPTCCRASCAARIVLAHRAASSAGGPATASSASLAGLGRRGGVRLRPQLVHRVHRPAGPSDPESAQAVGAGDPVPAGVRVELLRAHPGPARTGCG